jgi:hypothetical protein
MSDTTTLTVRKNEDGELRAYTESGKEVAGLTFLEVTADTEEEFFAPAKIKLECFGDIKINQSWG